MIRKIVFTLLVALLVGTVAVGSVSAGQEKVTVCHKPGTPAEATLEIAAPALNAHLGHGDYQGPCKGPESAGCAALNAVVPDPYTGSGPYFFVISDLDFFPGETIHADITGTSVGLGYHNLLVLNSNDDAIATQDVFFSDTQNTLSLDYIVIADDDADGVRIEGDGANFTVDSAHISCTPAP
jgi:hypothetical protein